MRTLWKSTTTMGLTALLASQFLVAEEQPRGGLTITPMGGYYMYDHDIEFDHHSVGGLALGIQTKGATEFQINYLAGSTNFSDTEIDIDLKQAYISALFHINRQKGSHPYLIFGGGEQVYEDVNGREFIDSIGVIGAGYQINFSKSLSLNPDVRALYNFDEETTTAAFMLGLRWHVGGHSKPLPPPPAPKDGDGDGIVDDDDRCPNTPPNTVVDMNGCVVDNDVDKDGVTNDVDQCPDTSAGAKVDENGCYIVITEAREVQLYVTFEDNSFVVTADSYEPIKDVAVFMREYPLTTVLLAGHTDSSGSANYNQTLSLKRAQAVAQLLSNRFGIDPVRVETVGYGESQPLYPNDTPANRAANRRVTATVRAMVETIQK